MSIDWQFQQRLQQMMLDASRRPENVGPPVAPSPAQSQDPNAPGNQFGMVGSPLQAAPADGGWSGFAPAPQVMNAPQQPAAGQSSGTGPAYGGGNPYLDMQGGAIARRMTDNLQRNVLPSISQFSAAGGAYGGSRQGVLEANAMKDMNLGLGDSLANLYGADWANEQNRNLTTRGQDMGFYTAQRGQDQTGAALGADLYSKGVQGQWSPIKNAADTYSPFTGLGTTTQTQNTGGGWGGAVGGALGAAQLGKNMGWWGN